MSSVSVSTRRVAAWSGRGALLVLLCCLLPAMPVAGGWGLQEESLSPGELDRAFELEVYHRLARRLGVEATRYVRITRFRNTLLVTGQVGSAALREEIDALILDLAGIRRAEPDAATVVPERTRDCGGRVVHGNVRRKQIVGGNADCSALRAAPQEDATGRLYNHLEVISGRPVKSAAAADLLAAQARYALVDAGYEQALDRDALRLAVQDTVVYILQAPDERLEAAMRAVLLQVPGVTGVQFYSG